MRLFCEAEYEDQAQHYAAVLGSRDINLDIETVEKINSRFFTPESGTCFMYKRAGFMAMCKWHENATRLES